MSVMHFPAMAPLTESVTAPAGLHRPPLLWITRRARRLQRFYGVNRRMAIYDAWRDYIDFTGVQQRSLSLVKGGRHA